jgi:hypothetical protein
MVRFHWHVEDGYGAYTPPQASKEAPGSSGVRHVSVQVDIAGEASPMEALFTIPAGYLHPEGGKVKDVGIVLGHGENAEEWNGPLLSEVAVTLAKAGEHRNSSQRSLLPAHSCSCYCLLQATCTWPAAFSVMKAYTPAIGLQPCIHLLNATYHMWPH